MSSLNLTLPVNLEPVKTADARVNTAFTAIQTAFNGNIEAENLTAATARSAGLNRGSEKVKGASIVATEEETTSATFTTLTTHDEVTVVLPSEGLIKVLYQASWLETVGGGARAAIFIGANQLKVASPTAVEPAVSEAQIGTGSVGFTPISSVPYGLVSGGGTAVYTGDVTTGQAIADSNSGGACYIFATAGTYAVSVQFKATAGTVKAKARRLYVKAEAFT